MPPPVYYDVGDYIHGSMVITLWKSFKVKRLKVLLEFCNHIPDIATKISNCSIYDNNYMTVAAAITLGAFCLLMVKCCKVSSIKYLLHYRSLTCCQGHAVLVASPSTRLPPSLVGQTDVKYTARYRVKGRCSQVLIMIWKHQ